MYSAVENELRVAAGVTATHKDVPATSGTRRGPRRTPVAQLIRSSTAAASRATQAWPPASAVTLSPLVVLSTVMTRGGWPRSAVRSEAMRSRRSSVRGVVAVVSSVIRAATDGHASNRPAISRRPTASTVPAVNAVTVAGRGDRHRARPGRRSRRLVSKECRCLPARNATARPATMTTSWSGCSPGRHSSRPGITFTNVQNARRSSRSGTMLEQGRLVGQPADMSRRRRSRRCSSGQAFRSRP